MTMMTAQIVKRNVRKRVKNETLVKTRRKINQNEVKKKKKNVPNVVNKTDGQIKKKFNIILSSRWFI